MLANIQPSDYIVVDKLDRMFRNTLDFLQCRQYFAERGVGLHFVNLLGVSFDTSSTGGGMFVQMLAFMAEMESDRIGDRVVSARKQRMIAGKHSGGAVPFFCHLVGGKPGKKSGSGGKLDFRPWAIEAMKKIVHLKDTTGVSFEKIGKGGLYEQLSKHMRVPLDNRRAAGFILYKLYWFYKAWEDAGKPDINTIKITDLVRNYRDKVERYGDDDGSTDADSG
jgi:hypothetical protein